MELKESRQPGMDSSFLTELPESETPCSNRHVNSENGGDMMPDDDGVTPHVNYDVTQNGDVTLDASNNVDDVDSAVENAEVREMEYLEYSVRCKKEDAWSVTAMAPTNHSGHLLVVDDRNSTVKLVDRQFALLHRYTSVFHPWGVAVLDDEFLVVTFPFVRLMQYYKFKDLHTKIVPWFPVRAQSEYYGVCGNKKRIAAVCRYDGENMTDTPGVHIMGREGILVHYVKKDHAGKQLFLEPDHIAMNATSELLYVSDAGTHSVVCLNLNGEVLSLFHEPGLIPRGLGVDQSNGNIYVSDVTSESVLRFNCNLDLVDKLHAKSETLTALRALTYCSKTDRVIISSENSPYVKVFII